MPKSISPRTKQVNPREQSDRILAIMIKKDLGQISKMMLDLARKNDPRPLSQINAEDLFKKYIKFGSRTQLLRVLKDTIKTDTLNIIIARLVSEDRSVVNEDYSLTRIDTVGNDKLNGIFMRAVKI